MNLMTELDAAEIGGIGEIKRKTLRFDSYRIGTEDGKLTIYAEVTNDIAPKIFTGYPVGQELLLDLINLYEDTKTRTPMGQAQLIIDWCLKNVHPYYLYALARFMAVNTGALEDWGGKTTIAFCEGCGRAYIKRGNRQKYCGNRECEAIRNSRKSSRYYYKEKAKT